MNLQGQAALVTGGASGLGAETARQLARGGAKVTILDVNLDGQPTFPVAEVLICREIPFIFATGYGSAGLPQSLRAIPVLHKPFEQRDLEKTLLAAWSAGPAQRLDRG